MKGEKSRRESEIDSRRKGQKKMVIKRGKMRKYSNNWKGERERVHIKGLCNNNNRRGFFLKKIMVEI